MLGQLQLSFVGDLSSLLCLPRCAGSATRPIIESLRIYRFCFTMQARSERLRLGLDANLHRTQDFCRTNTSRRSSDDSGLTERAKRSLPLSLSIAGVVHLPGSEIVGQVGYFVESPSKGATAIERQGTCKALKLRGSWLSLLIRSDTNPECSTGQRLCEELFIKKTLAVSDYGQPLWRCHHRYRLLRWHHDHD